MATGTVKWFNDSKGYGFITPDEGSKDLFVPFTNIARDVFTSPSEGPRAAFGPPASALRVVVLSGNGRHFQAGADLKWIRSVSAGSAWGGNVKDSASLAEAKRRRDGSA